MHNLTIAFYHEAGSNGTPVQEIRLQIPIASSATDLADGIGFYLIARIKEIIAEEVAPSRLHGDTLRTTERLINEGPPAERGKVRRAFRALRRWVAENESNRTSFSPQEDGGGLAIRLSMHDDRMGIDHPLFHSAIKSKAIRDPEPLVKEGLSIYLGIRALAEFKHMASEGSFDEAFAEHLREDFKNDQHVLEALAALIEWIKTVPDEISVNSTRTSGLDLS